MPIFPDGPLPPMSYGARWWLKMHRDEPTCACARCARTTVAPVRAIARMTGCLHERRDAWRNRRFAERRARFELV